MGWWNETPFGWGFGPLFMLIMFGLCMVMMFFMMRGMMGGHRRSADPLDILRERLARGLIREREYEADRRIIGDSL
jgi:uncharacterized membrane protein